MDFKAFLQPRFDPGHEFRGSKTVRRARRSVVILSHHDEFLPMDIESDLEQRAALVYLRLSRRGRGGHTVQNGVLFHRAGEPTKDSPASFTCHLETLFASLLSYGATTKLLTELLPLDEELNAVTIRNHLLKVAEQSEAEVEPEQVSFIEGCPAAWAELPIPNGPLAIGIDGRFIRNQRDKGWFEVIAGKSVLEFRRDDTGQNKSSKCFGFVQSYDDRPKRRLFELLKSQGMKENQQVVFLSDGGEDVRNLQFYLNAQAEETTRKLLKAVEEFSMYIQRNRGFIPNYGERYRNGERISTGFVESAVNQVISKRFVKKQQMRWTPRGAHLLLQTRTKVLNGDLEDTFRRWYPAFRSTTEAKAA